MLYIDVKYVGFIGSRLRNFKQKDTFLWNFSCPVCGDSSKVKTKARGYIFKKEQSLFVCCHNCDYSATLGNFLDVIDPLLKNEYRLEVFREKSGGEGFRRKKEEPSPETFKTDTAARLIDRTRIHHDTLLDGMLDRLDTLPPTHEAVKYVLGRKIPANQLHKMYFIPDMRDIVQLADKYKERIKTNEPRIVMPFYDLKGQLTGVTCRAMRGESLRYMVVKIKENEPLIFGINDIDRSKKVYVVEGPIDSMFMPNCIAVGGTSMGKIDYLGLKDTTTIFDNQPRNADVCRIQEKAIDSGSNIVVWNPRITEKDINDMAKAGINYMHEIESRTFSGLRAKLEFNNWKKCDTTVKRAKRYAS